MSTPASEAHVAQYIRMSTEHQRYSPVYQRAVLAAHAAARGYTIVRTYADEGVSGLSLERREGLKRLLADVLSGSPGFQKILVYDVSRWGRFQDPDESAHYEFLCRSAGVGVEYCAELFENDGSVASMLVKQLKRAMAAEYSRELSERVRRMKRSLGLDGCWVGGNPGLGLRRGFRMADGRSIALAPGECNAIKGRRMIAVLGPPEEVALVRRVFHLFTSTNVTTNALARAMNLEAPRGYRGRPWTRALIRRLLTNEMYLGTRVLGRQSVRFGHCEQRPEAEWVRVPGAGEPIVSRELFAKAQRRIAHRRRYSNAQLIEDLRALYADAGRLSSRIIDRSPRTAAVSLYRKRFGSLQAAYALVGYAPSEEQQRLTRQIERHRPKVGRAPRPRLLSDAEVLARLAELRDAEGRLDLELIEVTPGLPRQGELIRRFGSAQRMYQLLGHVPTGRQRAGFRRRSPRTGQDDGTESPLAQVGSQLAVGPAYPRPGAGANPSGSKKG